MKRRRYLPAVESYRQFGKKLVTLLLILFGIGTLGSCVSFRDVDINEPYGIINAESPAVLRSIDGVDCRDLFFWMWIGFSGTGDFRVKPGQHTVEIDCSQSVGGWNYSKQKVPFTVNVKKGTRVYISASLEMTEEGYRKASLTQMYFRPVILKEEPIEGYCNSGN